MQKWRKSTVGRQLLRLSGKAGLAVCTDERVSAQAVSQVWSNQVRLCCVELWHSVKRTTAGC